MKLFHLADLHLGKTIYERDLLEDQRLALEAVLEAARTERPALVILAGDVFDRAMPPPEAVSLFGDFVAGLKAADPAVTVAVIPGNHDSAQRLAMYSGVLGSVGVHVRAEAAMVREPVTVERDGEKARLWLLPFLTPGSIAAPPAVPAGEPAAGLAQGDLFADADRDAHGDAGPGRSGEAEPLRSQAALFAEAMRQVAPLLAAARAADPPGSPAADVLACHAFAAGGVSGDSERVFLGNAELVDASLFAAFDYVALGHLHRPQAAGRNGRYPGSLLAYSFGDADGDRGFLSVDLSRGRAEAALVPVRPLRRMVRVETDFDDALAGERWSSFEGDYVEAVLSDADAVLNPVEPLKRRFPFLLSVRQASFEREGGSPGERAPADDGPRREPLDDFRDFHAVMRGCPPEPDAEALFMELLAEARRAAE